MFEFLDDSLHEFLEDVEEGGLAVLGMDVRYFRCVWLENDEDIFRVEASLLPDGLVDFLG